MDGEPAQDRVTCMRGHFGANIELSIDVWEVVHIALSSGRALKGSLHDPGSSAYREAVAGRSSVNVIFIISGLTCIFPILIWALLPNTGQHCVAWIIEAELQRFGPAESDPDPHFPPTAGSYS